MFTISGPPSARLYQHRSVFKKATQKGRLHSRWHLLRELLYWWRRCKTHRRRWNRSFRPRLSESNYQTPSSSHIRKKPHQYWPILQRVPIKISWLLRKNHPFLRRLLLPRDSSNLNDLDESVQKSDRHKTQLHFKLSGYGRQGTKFCDFRKMLRIGK